MANISPLARSLLQIHVRRSPQLFYGTDTLGSLFNEKDLARLDGAYDELSKEGLMEPSGVIVSYFGSPKPLYRVTSKGTQIVEDFAA